MFQYLFFLLFQSFEILWRKFINYYYNTMIYIHTMVKGSNNIRDGLEYTAVKSIVKKSHCVTQDRTKHVLI